MWLNKDGWSSSSGIPDLDFPTAMVATSKNLKFLTPEYTYCFWFSSDLSHAQQMNDIVWCQSWCFGITLPSVVAVNVWRVPSRASTKLYTNIELSLRNELFLIVSRPGSLQEPSKFWALRLMLKRSRLINQWTRHSPCQIVEIYTSWDLAATLTCFKWHTLISKLAHFRHYFILLQLTALCRWCKKSKWG